MIALGLVCLVAALSAELFGLQTVSDVGVQVAWALILAGALHALWHQLFGHRGRNRSSRPTGL